MAKIITDDQNYIDIATTIREKTGSEETFKPNEMADKVSEVYDKGRQDEWSDFWDFFQQNGTKDSYRFAFFDWKQECYKPKYTIIAHKQNSNTFYYFRGDDTIVDIELSGVSNQFFHSAKLVTIRKLIVDETTTYMQCFSGCTLLENIVMEGVCASDIDFSSSPLTVESMKSVISCLKDYSNENPGANTLTLKDECKIALEAEGKTSPNDNLWTEYVADLGWNLA